MRPSQRTAVAEVTMRRTDWLGTICCLFEFIKYLTDNKIPTAYMVKVLSQIMSQYPILTAFSTIRRMAARGARVSMVDPRERRPCLKELEVIYVEQVSSLAGKRNRI